jgi:capsular exopolysaccharide synthesis family protein
VVLSNEFQREAGQPNGVMPDVHLRDYIAIVLQHMKLVVLAVVIALSLGALKVTSGNPEYRATTTLRVRQRQGPKEFSGDFSWWQTELSTYCRIIEGQDFARQAAKKLGITSRRDLGLPEERAGLVARIRKWVGQRLPTTRERPEEDGASPVDVDPVQFAGELRERTGAQAVSGTNLIRITYRAQDRERASEICHGLAQHFIDSEQDRQLKTARRWTKWFRDQQAQFQDKVARSEEELLEFHRKVDSYVSTVQSSAEGGASILQRTMETLQTRLAEVRIRRIELETQLEMLDGMKNAGKIPDGLAAPDNENIQQLLIRRRELRRELSAKTMRYRPKHPAIVQLKKSMEMLEENLERQKQDAIDAIRQRLEAVVAEEKKLNEELRTTQERAGEVNKKLVQYHALKRKAQANWKFFDTFIQKAEQAELAASISSVNIDLMTSNPSISRPPGRHVRTMLMALFLGLAAGVGLAFFADYMDTSLATPADIQRSLDLDQLAIFVHAESKKRGSKRPVLAAVDEPDSPLTENFRTLRSGVLFNPRFKNSRFLVITSSVAREGKSTVTANLAAVLAQAGKKVLLIDGDLRRPAVHSTLEVNKKPGLSEYLTGEKNLEEVAQSCRVDNLYVMSCGSKTEKPAELIGASQKRWEDLRNETQDYDHVLIDTPPLTLSDPTLLARSVGGSVLVVVRSGAVSRDVVRRSVNKLRAADADVAGVLLNDFNIRKQGYYGYYYRYYDYYDRHYYYRSGKRGGQKGGKTS